MQEEHLLVEGPRVERGDVHDLPHAVRHELPVEVLLALLDQPRRKQALPALVLRLFAHLRSGVDPLVPWVALLVLRGQRNPYGLCDILASYMDVWVRFQAYWGGI